ncbi:hypothetical protein DOS84_04885 [Flavobacterium aquariorum]|uniref:IPT/TIG domain-containing protein n=1 Tax=Flavobacterium aquariorum TaxID=2217670 RepID=A0A2W7UBM0_9FLAO|nr:IPT/TIG domain-containing protein [Flavobacterium aquariorum]PZX94889.1 hypothetical protein DOS84_04885 [Flavobacterium aquariorum]
MKNKKIKYLLSIVSMVLLVLGVFSSCSDDSADSGSGTLAITSVAKAEEGDLVPVTQGDPKNYYIIRGSGFTTVEKIYFNDFDTYFNPTMVTDTEIFVLIDEKTPYADATSKLKIVTKLGTIVYDFVIAPPSPSFGSFNPINAAEGDVITIYGNYFLDPIVKVGTETVPVISSTLTEIKVKLPAGADKKYISVTNISGTATSTYAVGTALFDDVAYYGFTFPAWNNHTYESEASEQGLIHIKKKMAAWDNMQGDWSWYDQIADYKGIRLSVKADSPGTLKLCFNGDWSERNMMTVTTGWNTFEFTWAELGNADHVQNITFQNMSKNAAGDGVENTFHIDNIGFVLK